MGLNPLIRLEGISFGYTQKAVLTGIDMTIGEGEVVALLGPNGCGKSTLIKIILGVLRPDRGRVFYNGEDIRRLGAKYVARQMAYVPQTHKTSFPYTVRDIVMMGRIPHKTFFFRYTKSDGEIAKKALESLSILHLADRAYTEISGGERQLALIARALAQGARTFIMDEPAGGLDYGNQLKLLDQIIRLSRDGYTFIKATHSPEHALWIADRAVMIKDGTVMAAGAAEEIINTQNLRRLYNASVNVLDNGVFRACVPQTICGCMGDAGQREGRTMVMRKVARG
ncbi:MAG: ABC transporter ATP-binding protein [Pseudomonadota bacterium]|nr:ABC transporter ATP-binding protein [Pseudomonadota bacterium]